MRQDLSRIQILEDREPKFYSKPSVIVGLPEAGLVGTIASSYLIQVLRLPEIGHIESDLEPPLVVVEKSEPKHAIRLFGREDLVIFLSDIPFPSRLSSEFSSAVVNWSLARQARLLIGVTGIPSTARLNLQQDLPRVFYITTRKELASSVSPPAEIFEEGLIAGTYALLLKACMRLGQPNMTFLAESHPNFPDPGAAAAIIMDMKSFLGIEIDVKQLLQESEQIRLKLRELMKRTQQSYESTPERPPGVYS